MKKHRSTTKQAGCFFQIFFEETGHIYIVESRDIQVVVASSHGAGATVVDFP